jgi:hypothetical protein
MYVGDIERALRSERTVSLGLHHATCVRASAVTTSSDSADSNVSSSSVGSASRGICNVKQAASGIRDEGVRARFLQGLTLDTGRSLQRSLYHVKNKTGRTITFAEHESSTTARYLRDQDKVNRQGLVMSNANWLDLRSSKWSHTVDQVGWDDVLMKIRFHGICRSTRWGCSGAMLVMRRHVAI